MPQYPRRLLRGRPAPDLNPDLDLDEYPASEVLQETVPEIPAVDVLVRNVVRTDEMPCRAEAFYKVIKGAPQKVLQTNPRRKLVILQNMSNQIPSSTSEFILYSKTKGQCDQMTGGLLVSGNAYVRLELPWPEEMWCRGVSIATGPAFPGFGADTNDSLLSVVVLDWSE